MRTTGSSSETMTGPAGWWTVAAAALGLAVVPVAFLAPVYSSGETISDQAGSLFYLALGIGVVLASFPALSGSARRGAVWTCGILLVASAFVTVLGLFFVPSGLLLCLAASRWSRSAAPDRPGRRRRGGRP